VGYVSSLEGILDWICVNLLWFSYLHILSKFLLNGEIALNSACRICLPKSQVTASNDGRLCVWSLAMLNTPQDNSETRDYNVECPCHNRLNISTDNSDNSWPASSKLKCISIGLNSSIQETFDLKNESKAGRREPSVRVPNREQIHSCQWWKVCLRHFVRTLEDLSISLWIQCQSLMLFWGHVILIPWERNQHPLCWLRGDTVGAA